MREPDAVLLPGTHQSDSTTTEIDRRLFPRYSSRARARLYRADDRMRFGLMAEIQDISVEGMGIVVDAELRTGESLGLALVNSIQRFTCELRGIVLWTQCLENGQYRAGIRFLRRIAPLDVSALRGRPRDDSTRGSTWL